MNGPGSSKKQNDGGRPASAAAPLSRAEYVRLQTLYGRFAGLVSLVCVSLMLFATGVFVIVRSSGGKGYPAIPGMICLIFFALAIYAVRKSFMNYLELKAKSRAASEDDAPDPLFHTAVHTPDEIKGYALRFASAALFFWCLAVLAFIRLLATFGLFWVLLFILAAAIAIFLTASVVTFIRLLPLRGRVKEDGA